MGMQNLRKYCAPRGGVKSRGLLGAEPRHRTFPFMRIGWRLGVVCYGDLVSVNKQTFFRDRLEVRVFEDRGEAGPAGAAMAAGLLRDGIARGGRGAGGVASTVAPGPFLGALAAAGWGCEGAARSPFRESSR